LPDSPGREPAARAPEGRTADALAVGLAALVAFLPFARGLALGRCFFFRDLSRYFFPARRFFAEGLQHAQLRLWNPYVHEGIPIMPLFYPLDVPLLLRNDEWTCSLLLALHVALAAAAMAGLLRSLDHSRTAAVGGGILYAVSGFGLSLVNLDIFVRAYAWAPLTVLALRRAARGGARDVVAAALACGVALSTLSTEVVAQTLLIAIVLAWPLRAGGLGRLAAVISLAVGLAAAPLLVQGRLIPGSARGALLPTDTSLDESMAPVVFLQTVVANLFGDLGRVGLDFWGGNHFSRGFPYILSIYVGTLALALAAVAVALKVPLRTRLLAIAAAGAFVCLGQHVRLDVLLQLFPPARLFRYPVKAFFAVQFAVSMLAAGGLDALARQGRRAWAAMGAAAGILGGILLGLALLGLGSRGVAGWLFRGFFPDGMPGPARAFRATGILFDAATGAGVAVAAAVLALLVMRGRLREAAGAALVCGLMAADLLRAGSGLNPMVTGRYYELTPGAAAAYGAVVRERGRVFTCDILGQDSYVLARTRSVVHSDSYVFTALMESMTPFTNVPFHVPTALSTDLFGLVPVERTLGDAELSCTAPEALRVPLRLAAVTHVVSADPLAAPWLEPMGSMQPDSLRPLVLYLYRVRDSLPRVEVARQVVAATTQQQALGLAARAAEEPGTVVVEGPAVSGGGDARLTAEAPGRLTIEVRAPARALVVVREGYDRAWRATVNGASAPVWRANGRHLAVMAPAGAAVIELRHRPWELTAGLLAAALSAAVMAVLLLRARRRAPGH
jgi:hypothetical protein